MALTLCAVASTAAAGSFRGPDSTLRIELGAPDASICYVRPNRLRVASACAGLNLDDAEQDAPAGMRLMAIVRRDTTSYMVTATWQERAHPGPLTAKDLVTLFAGAGEGVATSGMQLDAPEHLAVRGLQLIAFSGVSQTMATRHVMAFGRQAEIVVEITTNQVAGLRELAAKVIDSLAIVDEDVRPGAASPPAKGYGLEIGGIALVVVVGVGVLAIWKQRERRQRRRVDRLDERSGR